MDLLRETVLDLWEEKRGDLETDSQKYKKQLSVLETKRERIFEMREDGSYTKEEFLERKAEMDNQMATVRISLSESTIDQFDIEAAITYATKFVSDLDRQWVDLRDELKPRLQKLIFPEGIPYFKGKGFATTDLSLMLATQKTVRNRRSNVVTYCIEHWNTLIQQIKHWSEILPHIFEGQDFGLAAT